MMQIGAASAACVPVHSRTEAERNPTRDPGFQNYMTVGPDGAHGLDFRAWRGKGLDDVSHRRGDVVVGPGRRGRARENSKRGNVIAAPHGRTDEAKMKLVLTLHVSRRRPHSGALAELRQWDSNRERAKRIAARRKAARKAARGAQ